MAFFFGSNPAPAPGPAAPAPGGFSFGAAGGATNTQPAPAPAAGGFSFGPTPASAPGAAAPPTAQAPTPAPGGGFSFGGASTPAPAPAGGLSFPSTSTALAVVPGPAANTNINTANMFQVPDYSAIYHNVQISSKVQSLLAKSQQKLAGRDGSPSPHAILAGQELTYLLQCSGPPASPSEAAEQPFGSVLSTPKAIEWTAPNPAARQQLEQPNVSVYFTGPKQEAPLSSALKKAIIQLATELRISEANAIALLKAHDTTPQLQKMARTELNNDLFQALCKVSRANSVLQGPRALYFLEQSQLLQTTLLLLQSRLQGNDTIVEASDQLLQNKLVHNLILLIKDYSQKIDQLQQEVAQHKQQQQQSGQQQSNTGYFGQTTTNMATSSNNTGNKVGSAAKPPFSMVHLLFCRQQRQLAIESLFYLSYHTQLDVDEITAMLDLVKDLSNTLVPLNPMYNVPSPYHPHSPALSGATAGSWPGMALPPPQDKDGLDWQKELVSQIVESGQTSLLTCIAPLIAACVASLDSRQTLLDRQTHGPNAFGVGNSLLPPGEDATRASGRLSELHSRLTEKGSKRWQRKDIWGIFSAAYALLLRSAPALLASPRHGPAAASSPVDLRSASRDCLEWPAIVKTFTFCRLTLLPALQRLPSMTDSSLCDTSEFTVSVLSDMISHYLNILVSARDIPISREQWEQEKAEELELSRQEREREHKYRAWSGTSTDPKDDVPIPDYVDLMTRPDCMDDVMALASAICFLGPHFAITFWSKEGPDHDLVPSPTLEALEQKQVTDNSLLPSYLTFLAALSTAEGGADAVHRLLNRVLPNSDSGSANAHPTWTSMLETLRWYAQQLSPYNYDSVSNSNKYSSSARGAHGSSRPNTAYYYNADANGSFQAGASGRSSSGNSTSTGNTSSKPKELGQKNSAILASHLALLVNVAAQSATARCDILSVKLPVVTNGTITGADECLLILFSLAIAPLSPIMRGATMTAVSKLLQRKGSTEKQAEIIRDMALNGWELLENSQILPITLLDQYPQALTKNTTNQANHPGIAFPPSSISLSAGGSKHALMPADPNYGIVYELEHIETKLGFYPSTEGFLQMIASLVNASGCPSYLGQEWRLRRGCAPYVEFVADFLLPRVYGKGRTTELLPFRLQSDKSRLVSYALQVIESVVVQYNVPQDLMKSTNKLKTPETVLGIKVVSDAVVVPSPDKSSEKAYEDDFRNLSIDHAHSKEADRKTRDDDRYGSQSGNINPMLPSLPCTKDPGFCILSDILSSNRGNIFQALTATLVENRGADGITLIYGSETDDTALVHGLYGETPPSITGARKGVSSSSSASSKTLQTLLKSLYPAMNDYCTFETTAFMNGTRWREISLTLVLRIFCAVAVREAAFYSAILSSQEQLKLVPVLRFEKKNGPSSMLVRDIQVSRLSDLVLTTSGSEQLRSVLTGVIGYSASTETDDILLSSHAVAFFHFLYKSGPASITLNALCSQTSQGQQALAQAVAKRMLVSSKRLESDVNTQTIGLVLHMILDDVHDGIPLQGFGLAQCLLGLPSVTHGGSWSPDSGTSFDCFDAALTLIGRHEFAEQSESSAIASLVFEMIYRLLNLVQGGSNSLRVVIYTAERLRHVGFFQENLIRFLGPFAEGSPSYLNLLSESPQNGFENIIHSISWLLKATSIEMRLLSGLFNVSGTTSQAYLAPKPSQCFELLDLLFGSGQGLMQMAVFAMPLDRVHADPSLKVPPIDALRESTVQLVGPSDICSGYEIVEMHKLKRFMQESADLDEYVAWVGEWNRSVAWHCAAGHLAAASHCLIGSSLMSSKGLGQFQTLQGRNTAIDETGGFSDTLAIMLRRLSDNASPGRHKGMDTMLFPPSTLQLSSTILLLVDHIAASNENGADPAWESSSLNFCGLLTEAIHSSWKGEEHSRFERSALLAAALAVVIRAVVTSGFDMSGNMAEIVPPAQTLVQMASYNLNEPDLMESSAVVAAFARTALMSILDAFQDSDQANRENCLTHAVFDPALESLLKLVPQFDDTICHLLEKISIQKFGHEILLHGGIFDALLAAAERYNSEERRTLESMKQGNAAFREDSVGAPAYLYSHFKLIMALLSSGMTTIAEKSLQVFASYEMLLRRLCLQFPRDIGITRLFMNCLLQAASILRPVGTKDSSSFALQRSDFHRLLVDGTLVNRVVFVLVNEIAANPWPLHLSTPLPRELETEEKKVKSHVVEMHTLDKQTWWDRLESILKGGIKEQVETDSIAFRVPCDMMQASGETWNRKKFDYVIASAEILRLGLSLVKRTRHSGDMNFTTIWQGLCRCAETAQHIQIRLGAIQKDPDMRYTMVVDDIITRQAEIEYLTSLGIKFAQCVQEFLILVLLRLRAAKVNPNAGESASSFGTMRRQISLALDRSQIESKGIGCLDLLSDSSAEVAFGMTVLQEIRKEMQ